MSFPAPPSASLDASWNEVLVYAAGHNWQFGKDIVFTYGPWGYLCSVVHVGDIGWISRLAWELGGKLILSAGVVSITRRLPLTTQVVFVSACIWSSWILMVSFYLVVACLAVVWVLLSEEEDLPSKLVWTFILAFLSELKFTGLVLTAFGVAVATGMYLWKGRWRTATALAATYFASLLFWWVLAGQNLENVLPYLASSLEITRGYSNAMGSDENLSVFITGAALMVAWAGFLFDLLRRKGDRVGVVAVATFLAFTAFTLWKYSFTRADAHTNSLFLATLLLAMVLPRSLMPERRWHWFWAAGLIGLIGFERNDPKVFVACAATSVGRIRDNVDVLFHTASLPGRWRAQFTAASAIDSFPRTNERVGSSSVDLFNCDQGLLLIYGLNYAPRPVFQSYYAYTPTLGLLNLEFYRTASAPAFVLWRDEVIDGRFPTTDDAQLIVELPRAYAVQFMEKEYLLLKRTHDLPARPLRRALVAERSVRFGQVVDVPSANGNPLWLQLAFKLNILGQARSIAYKPPQISMNVVDLGGKGSTWRILPAVAADGFLLVPFLESTEDFADFFRGRFHKGVRTIQFESPLSQAKFWNQDVTVRFWSLPELAPAQAPEPSLREGAKSVDRGLGPSIGD